MKLLLSGLVLVFLAATAGASAKQTYSNPPPGAVVQDVVVYLAGEGMSSRWHVVSSRSLVGKQNGKQNAYQWYVSIYAPVGNGWNLTYRSPGDGTKLLGTVTKVKGAQLYLPQQSVRIVGGAELEQPTVQDAVIQVHESSADCGQSVVAVIGALPSLHPAIRTTVVNGCDLQASIVKYGQMQAVQLTGPYYGPKAPMCCPTKPKATAKLTYSGQIRGWNVTPNYFKLK